MNPTVSDSSTLRREGRRQLPQLRVQRGEHALGGKDFRRR